MTSHSLLSLGLAALCIVAAVFLWRATGSQPFPLPHLATFAHRAPASASTNGSSGVLSGPRNLQAAINSSNSRVAGALNAAK